MILLLVSIPFSLFCLSIAFSISRNAKSPMSFIGLILCTFLSSYPAITFISDDAITFKDSPILYPLQIGLLLLLIIPFWELLSFTLKWKKDYYNSGDQTVSAWRKLKNILELKLKSSPLKCSISEKETTYTANIHLNNGKYILNIYSNEMGHKLLVTENEFNNIDCLNQYLTNFTKFRLGDFLN